MPASHHHASTSQKVFLPDGSSWLSNQRKNIHELLCFLFFVCFLFFFFYLRHCSSNFKNPAAPYPSIKKKGTNSSSDGFGDNKADSIWATISFFVFPPSLSLSFRCKTSPLSLSLPIKNTPSHIVLISTRMSLTHRQARAI